VPELTVYATTDCYLSGVSKDTNYGAGPYALSRILYGGGTKVAWERSLGNFDVSELAGATITAAKLVRRVWSITGPGGHQAFVSRCTRPADWVENQATWNQYKSGSNWTTAGGDFDDTTPGKITYTEPTATGDHEIAGLGPYVEDALANRNGIVSLHLRLADEDPDVDQGAAWRTKEYGSDVWRLVIDYDDPLSPDPGRRSFARTTRDRSAWPARPAAPASGARPARSTRPSMRRRR